MDKVGTPLEYRGFLITHPTRDTWRVYRCPRLDADRYATRQEDELITAQPSLEFAKRWVDAYWET